MGFRNSGKKPAAVKVQKNSYVRKKDRMLTVMSMPALILLFLFQYLPLFGLVLAFKDYKYDSGFLGSKWVGLKNFTFFFKSQDAFTITRNTILYNLIFIISVLAGSVIFALILNGITRRGAVKIYQTVMFFPYFLSYAVIAFIVFAFLNVQYGLLNRLSGANINWYADMHVWLYIIPIVNFWKCVGYNTIIIYASLIAIDTTFIEAAAVDGASRFQIICKVVMPLLKPIVVMLALIMLGKIFYSDFGLFYMVPQNAGLLYPVTDVIDTYVYRTLRVLGDVGMSTAIGLYQSLVGLVLVLIANWLTRKFCEESALF